MQHARRLVPCRYERNQMWEMCGRSFSWWFRVDLAAVGAPRQQRRGGGFKSKADAVEAMNRLQASVVDGTYVERSRLTLGEYLEEWLAACRNIRPNTVRDYSVSPPSAAQFRDSANRL
jgi:hypothetical protein